MDGPGRHYAKWYKLIRKDKYDMISLMLESNEQTELTSKIERLIVREQDDNYGGWLGSGRVE